MVTSRPPRSAARSPSISDWLARARRFDSGGPNGRPWVRDYLRAGVEVDAEQIAATIFGEGNPTAMPP